MPSQQAEQLDGSYTAGDLSGSGGRREAGAEGKKKKKGRLQFMRRKKRFLSFELRLPEGRGAAADF